MGDKHKRAERVLGSVNLLERSVCSRMAQEEKLWMSAKLRELRHRCPWFNSQYSQPVTVRQWIGRTLKSRTVCPPLSGKW